MHTFKKVTRTRFVHFDVLIPGRGVQFRHHAPLNRARLRVTFSPPILPSTCPAAQVVVKRGVIDGVVLTFGTNLNRLLNLEVVSTIASEFRDDVVFFVFWFAHHCPPFTLGGQVENVPRLRIWSHVTLP